MAEIDLRIASLEDVPDPADDPADAVPELPARSPLTKPGDLWLLGPHRVLCGNALDRADFVTLMGGERAGMVFTFGMASGEMSEEAFTAFLETFIRQVVAFSSD